MTPSWSLLDWLSSKVRKGYEKMPEKRSRETRDSGLGGLELLELPPAAEQELKLLHNIQ